MARISLCCSFQAVFWCAPSWNLELIGLVTPTRTVGLSELIRLDQTLTVAVLQCAVANIEDR